MAIQLLQIHGLWPVVSMDNKALRRNILENLWQGNFGKRYIDTLFWMSKSIKIFVSHVKLTKGWPQQRRILIINWLGWPDSLWIPPDSLFPQLPVIGQWAYERRGQAGRHGGYAWAQQHGLPLSKAYLAMATAECPICQQQILSLSPQYGPFPWGDQPVTWWQVGGDTGLFPPWKGQNFVLIGLDTLDTQCFCPNYHSWRKRMPFPLPWNFT